jgi:hypothetical protein
MATATVVVDKGKKDGLLPGMELQVVKRDSIYHSVELTKVEETQSEGEIVYFSRNETLSLFSSLFGKPTPESAEGLQLSTRPSR